MDEQLISTLKEYGFSEKEAKIYLTTLELGSAPASTIARHAEEKRTSVYALLKKMKQAGTIEEIKRKDTAYFSVVDPQLLLKELKHKAAKFEDIVPMLLAKGNEHGTAPKIHYFEGTSGLKKMFEDFATSEVDMRVVLGTSKYFNKKLLKHVGVYRRARQEKELKTYRLMHKEKLEVEEIKAGDKEHNRKTRYVDNLPFDIATDVNIYGPNKVSFLFFDGYEQPHVIIIEDENVYRSMYSIFEALWKASIVK